MRGGVTWGQWFQGWYEQMRCEVVGHAWGPWMNETDDPFMAQPQTRCCRRCMAWEDR